MSNLTDTRGRDYGHPRDQFACAEGMYAIWQARRQDAIERRGEEVDAEEESALRHVMHMFCTKMSRAAHNPERNE